MVNENAVLKVLSRVDEVQAKHGQFAARTTVISIRADTYKVAAKANHNVANLCITANRNAVIRGVYVGVVPFLN